MSPRACLDQRRSPNKVIDDRDILTADRDHLSRSAVRTSLAPPSDEQLNVKCNNTSNHYAAADVVPGLQSVW